MQTKYLCVLIHIWIKGEVGAPWNRFKPASKIFYWPFQGSTSFVDLLCFCSVLCLLCLCARLFICALWSPAGKGLTSWLSFVVSNCEFVTFPLVSLVRCGTWLYRFLIFAPLFTLLKLYNEFRKERFLDRTKKLSDTIHTNNIKTCQSIKAVKPSTTTSKKKKNSEAKAGHRVLEIAQARGYSTKELFRYDLIPTSYLMDEDGLMKLRVLYVMK